MADFINPYMSVLAPYFPNSTGQEYKQDIKKVTHYLVHLNQIEALNQWLNPDPQKLQPNETIQDKLRQRINTLVTDKQLHPLHLCAMLNRVEMAKMLLETKLCQLDPQDDCRFTPLHHAAVNDSQTMIGLLVEYGADPHLKNTREGTYLDILNLVHPSTDSLKQMFHYKDPQTEQIVPGNGADFQRFTGAQVFLDKEPVISVEEIVDEWSKNPPANQAQSAAMSFTLKKAYDQFLRHPPKLYIEKREDVGINVVANEDIKSGTIIAEYLGEIKTGSRFTTINNSYLFDPFDGEKKRGIGAVINDGFPNCMTFSMPNIRGVLNRIFICTTTRIPKGSSVVYNYGIGDPIKFGCHRELNDKAMQTFFESYAHQGFNALVKDYEKQLSQIKNMKEKKALASSYDSLNKLLYLAITPHAILKLVCTRTISIESAQQLSSALSEYYNNYPTQQKKLLEFISKVKDFSDLLDGLEPEKAEACRTQVLGQLPHMDIEGLSELLMSFG